MEKAILTAEQLKSVKGFGFLHNRGTRKFSARVITENGSITTKQMQAISLAAEKFAEGRMVFTVRLTIEVPGIEYENIEPFREFLAENGLKTGGTGTRVRPVVGCKGTTCVFGLCDTMQISKDIHDRFYEGYYNVVLPHKMKIAVGGCPNNCAKPDLNDIGLVGQRVINYQSDKCRNCKVCTVIEVCPMKAVTLENGAFAVDTTLCNNCGRCLNKCHFGVTEEARDMMKIYIGGKWGKKIRLGSQISKLFTVEEAMDTIEKAILLFKREGSAGERFGETIDRVGLEKFEEMLLCDTALKEKAEILQK